MSIYTKYGLLHSISHMYSILFFFFLMTFWYYEIISIAISLNLWESQISNYVWCFWMFCEDMDNANLVSFCISESCTIFLPQLIDKWFNLKKCLLHKVDLFGRNLDRLEDMTAVFFLHGFTGARRETFSSVT